MERIKKSNAADLALFGIWLVGVPTFVVSVMILLKNLGTF
jgi:hypothetical protein